MFVCGKKKKKQTQTSLLFILNLLKAQYFSVVNYNDIIMYSVTEWNVLWTHPKIPISSHL